MPHPIYGQPRHQLETVTVRITLPSPTNGFVTQARAVGEASTRRTSLWSESVSWSADEVTHGLQPADWVNHVVLCTLQDRPASQEALDDSLIGQGWEDVQLPF